MGLSIIMTKTYRLVVECTGEGPPKREGTFFEPLVVHAYGNAIIPILGEDGNVMVTKGTVMTNIRKSQKNSHTKTPVPRTSSPLRKCWQFDLMSNSLICIGVKN